MMRAFLTAAVAMAAAWLPVFAQPGPPANTVLTATAVADPAGGSILVRNTAAAAVTAFVYIYTMHGPGASVLFADTGYYDSAIDPQSQPPIKPGQEVRIPYRIPFAGARPVVGAEAGLFADGGSFGEPEVVRSILDRRNYTLVSLNKSIADLKEAAQNGLSRQETINLFMNSLMSEASGAGDSDLAICIRTVRGQVLAALSADRRRPDGTPIPVPESIQSQIDALAQRRDALRAAVRK
jgi:hypothetical protein